MIELTYRGETAGGERSTLPTLPEKGETSQTPRIFGKSSGVTETPRKHAHYSMWDAAE